MEERDTRKDIKMLIDMLPENELPETLEFVIFKMLKSVGEYDYRRGIVDSVLGHVTEHTTIEELKEYLSKS